MKLSDRRNTNLDASGSTIPIGTIVAYAPGYYGAAANSGGWTQVGPAGNTVSDVNSFLPPNWRVCNGTAPNVSDSPIFNSAARFLPDLTGSRFVMGSTAAGTAGGNTNNQVTLTTTQLPAHDHPAGTLANNTVTAPHSHPSVSATGTAAAASAPHSHPAPAQYGDGGATVPQRFMYVDTAAPFVTTLTTNSANAPHAHPSVSVSGSADAANAPHTHTISGTAGTTGTGSAFSIAPQYVTSFYIMRIK